MCDGQVSILLCASITDVCAVTTQLVKCPSLFKGIAFLLHSSTGYLLSTCSVLGIVSESGALKEK